MVAFPPLVAADAGVGGHRRFRIIPSHIVR
jgi:hypothetical protein